MKRPPGLWLLLSAGVLWLMFHDACAVRATSLIFGRGSTSSTTSEAPSSPSNSTEEIEDAAAVTELPESNVTTPKLSGIPQIDYIYDPNLPKELNGFNLTDYPFYERVPEDIDFKCDGLHDGFYASVPHGCQVYHHCLFGTRFDFLCANYTAFDQKTFICHFVSEVDCANSKNFWHRNDALYQAASTTTIKPVIIYTPPPQPAILMPSAARRPIAPPIGGGRRRRPYRRRRPQYDYYDEYEDEDDEYYEEPRYQATPDPRSERRKRPRPRPRPIYDDEYEEYEDERYERRGGSRRDEDRDRRPYDRRRNKDNRRPYDDEEDGRKSEDRRPSSKNDDDKLNDDRRKDERRNDEKRTDDKNYDDKRKPDDNDKKVDESSKIDDRRSFSERKVAKRPSDDRRPDKRRPYDDDDYDRRSHDRPRKGYRRPYDDDEERPRKRDDNKSRDEDRKRDDDRIRKDDRRRDGERKRDDERRKDDNRNRDDERIYDEDSDIKPSIVVKPSSGSSVYDRPRAPPRIRPPVPKSEAPKYSFKTSTIKPTPKPVDDEEYYDDYEDEPPKTSPRPASKPKESERRPYKPTLRGDPRKPSISSSRPRGQPLRKPDISEEADDVEEKYERRSNKKPEVESRDKQLGSGSRKRPIIEDYYDEEEVTTKDSKRSYSNRFRENKEDKLDDGKPIEESRSKIITTTTTSTTTTTTPSTTTTTTTKEPHRDKHEPIVRVVKRPFLPSRGGNPYMSRGLQPVGAKAVENKRAQNEQKTFKPKDEELEEDLPEQTPRKVFPDPPRRVPSKSIEEIFNPKPVHEEEAEPVDEKKIFKPSPVVIKVPIRNKYVPLDGDEFKPVSNRPQLRPFLKPVKEYQTEQRTTQKPKGPDPLDLIENEYDVTLNDALNPTLPNLPVRGFPAGFSQATDYTFSAFQRPRYVADPVLNSASSEIAYRVKQPVRYEALAQNTKTGSDYVGSASNIEYNTQYTAPNGRNFQAYRQNPRLTQANTQAFYANY